MNTDQMKSQILHLRSSFVSYLRHRGLNGIGAIKRFSSALFLIAVGVFVPLTLMLSRGSASDYLFRRGIEAKKEWQLEKAVRYFDWSLRLRRDNVRAKFEKGLCHQLRGDFLSSGREFDALMTEPIRDLSFQAQLLNAVGVNGFNSNEPDRAMELHTQSLSLARELGDKRLQAQALIDLSRVLY